MAREVRALLDAHRDDILRTLRRLDRQAKGRDAAGDVLTHGDPNGANILRDDAGRLHLVDWDDLAPGPPERDLVFFLDDHFDVFRQAYIDAGGSPLLRPAWLAFYVYSWDLGEIADWGTRLLTWPLDRDEEARAFAEFSQYVPLRHEAIAESIDRWC